MRAAVTVVAASLIVACGAQDWSFDDAGVTPASLGCVDDTSCKLPGLHCDPGSGLCVACLNDSQCPLPTSPRCDAALHQCVQCGVTGDCPSGDVCDLSSLRCVPSCADGGACPASAPKCSQPRQVCVGCSTNADCAASTAGPICNVGAGQCVQCTVDAQCSSETPRCDLTDNTCVHCLTSADCHEQHPCDPSTHTCVEH